MRPSTEPGAIGGPDAALDRLTRFGYYELANPRFDTEERGWMLALADASRQLLRVALDGASLTPDLERLQKLLEDPVRPYRSIPAGPGELAERVVPLGR